MIDLFHFLRVYKDLNVEVFDKYRSCEAGFEPYKFIYEVKGERGDKYWWVPPVIISSVVTLGDKIPEKVIYTFLFISFSIISYFVSSYLAVNLKFFRKVMLFKETFSSRFSFD